MAFLHRIGKSTLKTASFQFHRCYTHLPHASTPKPKTLPTVMPYSHSLFHNTRPTILSQTVSNNVSFYSALVQVKIYKVLVTGTYEWMNTFKVVAYAPKYCFFFVSAHLISHWSYKDVLIKFDRMQFFWSCGVGCSTF